jgi:hypothetical protein
LPGRPPADRQALARAFVVKAVLGLPHTNHLIDRLIADNTLRRLTLARPAALAPRGAGAGWVVFAGRSRASIAVPVARDVTDQTLEAGTFGHQDCPENAQPSSLSDSCVDLRARRR